MSLMTGLIKNRLLFVLIALFGITLLSWLVADFMQLEQTITGVLLIVFAFIKVRLIIIHYMEAGLAPLPIRLAYEAWVFVVAGMTLAMYLA